MASIQPNYTDGGPKACVLVVDDENDNLEFMLRVLKTEYNVVTAADGLQGLIQLQTHNVDLIITDQRMPNMQGVEFLTRARDTNPDIVRIVLTGYPDVTDLIEAVNRGEIYRYLTKPISPQDLKLTVRQGLERATLARDRARLVVELQNKNTRLEQVLGELRDLNVHLEEVVEQRTQELSTANSELQLALDQVSQLARTDPLTGLFNRRYFKEQLEREIARALRYARPTALVLFDLDHFKDVNDRHGHVIGDRVLVRFAEILRSTTRKPEVVARVGGEEFVVLLPETESAGARTLAERVRLLQKNEGLHTTVSAGVAAAPEHAKNADELYGNADKCLYRAKQGGRDRVELAGVW
ncbi:MAG: diguanylate cyclase [Deltaproteobacteria bacterium]|nr:diguanylate cyclase [Deltaproteobacteria bacterium]